MSKQPRVLWLILVSLALLVMASACGAPSGGGAAQPAAPKQEAKAPAAQPTQAPAAPKPTDAPKPAPTQPPAAAKPTDAPKPAEAPKPAAPSAASPGVNDVEIVIGSWGPQDGPAGAY